MLILTVILVLTVVVLGIAGSVWVMMGTLRKSRAGINMNGTVCPTCGTPQPRLRKPKNMRQFLWGGSTCSQCGTEMDKWGRVVEAAPNKAYL